MWVHAIHSEDGEVIIICIQSGNPKNYSEMMIVYVKLSDMKLACDDTLANFTITE